MAAIWAALGFLGVLLAVALGDLVSEEIRGWLDLVPHGILRLAAAQLDEAQQNTIYEDEWLPELQYALRGAESLPITRLILGTRFAFGLLIAARRVSRDIDRELSTTPVLYPDIHDFELAEWHFINTTGGSLTVHPTNGETVTVSNGNAYIGPMLNYELRRLEELGILVDWRQ